MEYYIYITNNCNLSCHYCCGKTTIHHMSPLGSEITRQKSIPKVMNYILDDMGKNKHSENNIIFYGGEPLLNQNDVIEIINCTQENNKINKTIRYILYTNGVLLHSVDPLLLKNIHYLFVSIDGTESIHNKNRGHNTYRKIIKNVSSLNGNFKGETVARVTITNDSMVDEAVLSVVDKFDNIFWQIENSEKLDDLDVFFENYKQGITKLLSYWISNIQKGVIKNLIPFQAITTSILLNHKYRHFRCGAGSTLRVIDIEGKVHLCDEIMCDDKMDKENFLIKEDFNPEDWTVDKLSKYCNNCDVRYICGGNCLHAMLAYPSEKFLFYCDLTKDLIVKINNILPIIKKELLNGTINMEQLNTYISRNGTEQIP